MKNNLFVDKTIALLGLGLENLSLAKLLLESGFNLAICDYRSARELGERYHELLRLSQKFKVQINWRLGKKFNQKLYQFDFLLRSPGWPLFCPEVLETFERGSILSSPIKLFFKLCPAPIIGVTGTKGKGTTSTLIYKMLKAADKKVYLGGNIGTAPFDFWKKLTPRHWVVLELSSFQLEDMFASPKIAVITNVTSEHLKAADPHNPNYHHSRKKYLKAKRNIFEYQRAFDQAVFNLDEATSRKMSQQASGQVFYFSRQEKPRQGVFVNKKEEIIFRAKNKNTKLALVSEVKMRGVHNLENICAASLAARLAGANFKAIKKVITTFRGLEHRLELAGRIKGVRYYNDASSTTPESTITALRALADDPKILLLGGAEKGSDFTKLARELTDHKIKAIILVGETAPRIKKDIVRTFSKKKVLPYMIKSSGSMKEIVRTASSLAEKGDLVLLSPACASFDMFVNYKARGLSFKEAVKKLRN